MFDKVDCGCGNKCVVQPAYSCVCCFVQYVFLVCVFNLVAFVTYRVNRAEQAKLEYCLRHVICTDSRRQ